MAYSLGVDLGTTFSAAATIGDDGVPTMVGLGNRALQIPSVVFVRDEESMLVGEQAEREASTDPTRVVREFKRRIGDDVPIVVAGRPYSAELMMAQVLRWVVEQTTERHGEAPARVTLTHPAAWTPDYKVGKLLEAARLAGLEQVSTCPEPVAAAMNYASQHRVEVGDRICVYDLGGGTFDVCVLAKTVTGFEILGKPGGDARLGGIDFDKAITAKVSRDLTALFEAADPDDPGFFRFQRDCVEAKESLSSDVAAAIPVSIAGTTTSVRLTRAEFEAMIDPMVTETMTKTALELSSAGVDPADLRSIVLIGGSSRIPLVTEKLTSAFRCPVARNTHPKHDVALGAALAGRLETSRATAVRTGGSPVVREPTATQPAPRRRLVRASAAGVGAVVIIVGGWVASGRLTADTADSRNSTPSAVAQTASPASGADSATPSPSLQSPTASAGSGPSTAGPTAVPSPSPTQAVGGQTPAPTTIAPPPSFDQATVSWFRQLCNGGDQLGQLEVPADKLFPTYKAARTEYADSFAQGAIIADGTASRLEQITQGPVAGGAIDPAQMVQGLRDAAVAMRAGAQSLQQLPDPTKENVADIVLSTRAQIKKTFVPVDPSDLTDQERAFVGSLPGCELINQ